MSFIPFLHGALTALTLVVALMFARMWRRASDRFYLIFALSFGVLCVHWYTLSGHAEEHTTWPYVTRLIAFVLIIIAIIDKNRRASRS